MKNTEHIISGKFDESMEINSIDGFLKFINLYELQYDTYNVTKFNFEEVENYLDKKKKIVFNEFKVFGVLDLGLELHFDDDILFIPGTFEIEVLSDGDLDSMGFDKETFLTIGPDLLNISKYVRLKFFKRQEVELDTSKLSKDGLEKLEYINSKKDY